MKLANENWHNIRYLCRINFKTNKTGYTILVLEFPKSTVTETFESYEDAVEWIHQLPERGFIIEKL